MANVCAICSKGKKVGHNVSHADNRTKRLFYPNLQRVRAVVDGSPKTIKVCTRCIRAGKVRKVS